MDHLMIYLSKNYGKSPFLIGKSTINGPCSIANCYEMPEGFLLWNYVNPPFSVASPVCYPIRVGKMPGGQRISIHPINIGCVLDLFIARSGKLGVFDIRDNGLTYKHVRRCCNMLIILDVNKYQIMFHIINIKIDVYIYMLISILSSHILEGWISSA